MYGARNINKEKELHEGVGPSRPLATTPLLYMNTIIFIITLWEVVVSTLACIGRLSAVRYTFKDEFFRNTLYFLMVLT